LELILTRHRIKKKRKKRKKRRRLNQMRISSFVTLRKLKNRNGSFKKLKKNRDIWPKKKQRLKSLKKSSVKKWKVRCSAKKKRDAKLKKDCDLKSGNNKRRKRIKLKLWQRKINKVTITLTITTRQLIISQLSFPKTLLALSKKKNMLLLLKS
jgi:hypothetical protein